LNLSDIRNSSSVAFIEMLGGEEIRNLPHSIFFAAREAELASMIYLGDPVYLAWGTNRKTRGLRQMAFEQLKAIGALELNPSNNDHDYHHPLVRHREPTWKEKAIEAIGAYFANEGGIRL
jgi:hypothetical protein